MRLSTGISLVRCTSVWLQLKVLHWSYRSVWHRVHFTQLPCPGNVPFTKFSGGVLFQHTNCRWEKDAAVDQLQYIKRDKKQGTSNLDHSFRKKECFLNRLSIDWHFLEKKTWDMNKTTTNNCWVWVLCVWIKTWQSLSLAAVSMDTHIRAGSSEKKNKGYRWVKPSIGLWVSLVVVIGPDKGMEVKLRNVMKLPCLMKYLLHSVCVLMSSNTIKIIGVKVWVFHQALQQSLKK